MEGTIYTISLILVEVLNLVLADFQYMVSTPEPISLSFGFDTLLTCEMNIEPDKFQWKFYPSDDPYNPNAMINLSNATFHLLPEEKFTKQKKKSALILQVKNTNIAGDYQCLAYYGAYVVASIPWQLSIVTLKDFPYQENTDVTVVAGNTVSWRCLPPESNPEAYIDYFKNEKYIIPPFPKTQIKSLILPNVSMDDSGVYRCNATNIMKNVVMKSHAHFKLNVVRNGPYKAPFFIIEPRKTYTIVKDETAFLECSAVGIPVPRTVWFKKNGQLPSDRIEMLSGGLKIKNITSSDDGTYVCNHTNVRGTISHEITLIYQEEPVVECLTNITDVTQGESLSLDCEVMGIPKPELSWFLNGFSVNNDSLVEVNYNKIYFKPVEKRHAGKLQIFARNKVKTVYSSITLIVIPLSTSIEEAATPPHTHHRHRGKTNATRKPSKPSKTTKMIPPSKPTISRLNDESVVVRWNVPVNNGLPIQFFKVQYRELGPASSSMHHSNRGARWKTTNEDIPPNIKDYDVTNLKPDHVYRFRIAAVYSNNDNKLSPNSDKFHLRRLDFDDKNPLPIPLITHTETINVTSVKIIWECPAPNNVTIDGFYISYMSASTAGDYLKATVDGASTTEYVITHLQQDTIYDVKLQSFNSKFASDFSAIMKARTANPLSQSSLLLPPMTPTPSTEAAGFNLYVIIGGVVIICVIVVCVIVFLLLCRNWKKNKTDNRDKASVEDCHVQAEGNEYVVGPKSSSRANGCAIAPNRITITPNPLADADNKNQNMIEMSCLTAQNNNCASINQDSSSSSSSGSTSPQESPSDSKQKTKQKKREKHKLSVENISSGENYV